MALQQWAFGQRSIMQDDIQRTVLLNNHPGRSAVSGDAAPRTRQEVPPAESRQLKVPRESLPCIWEPSKTRGCQYHSLARLE